MFSLNKQVSSCAASDDTCNDKSMLCVVTSTSIFSVTLSMILSEMKMFSCQWMIQVLLSSYLCLEGVLLALQMICHQHHLYTICVQEVSDGSSSYLEDVCAGVLILRSIDEAELWTEMKLAESLHFTNCRHQSAFANSNPAAFWHACFVTLQPASGDQVCKPYTCHMPYTSLCILLPLHRTMINSMTLMYSKCTELETGRGCGWVIHCIQI